MGGKGSGRKSLTDTTIERTCQACKQLLPVEKFYQSFSISGGITYVCRKCNTKKKAEVYIKERLKKYGEERIRQEISDLINGIELRIKILTEVK